MPPTATAPPPPAKTETPVTQPSPSAPADTSNFSDDFAALDQLDDSPKDKAPDKPQAKTTEKTVELPEKQVDKPPDKREVNESVKDDDEPRTVVGVRNAYREKKKEIKEVWTPKVKSLEAKIAELEGRPNDVAPVQQKLEAAQKRLEELEGAIKFVDYKKSDEYRNNYEKPYNEAWAEAQGDVEQLKVRLVTGKDELGEPTYGTRQATVQDILTLANMPIGEVDDAAESMFGKSAPRVIRHVEQIKKLAKAQEKAIADAQKRAVESNGEQQRQLQERNRQSVALWNAANQELSKKYANWFAPAEGDTEGNALLEKGFKTADRLFTPTDDNPAPKTPQEAVALHALIRNKAANHDRLALRLKTTKARVAELEKELEQFKTSEPRGRAKDGTTTKSTGHWEDEVNAELDALDKR